MTGAAVVNGIYDVEVRKGGSYRTTHPKTLVFGVRDRGGSGYWVRHTCDPLHSVGSGVVGKDRYSFLVRWKPQYPPIPNLRYLNGCKWFL